GKDRFRLSHGQIHLEGCTVAQHTLHADGSSMMRDNPVNYRKAHAGALAHLFGGEIGVKNPPHDSGCYAASCVTHRKLDIGAWLQLMMLRRYLVERQINQTHIEDSSGIFHGLHCIHYEMNHDLMDLGWIGQDNVCMRCNIQ